MDFCGQSELTHYGEVAQKINYVNDVIYKGKTLLHTPMATAKETADLAWVVLSSRVSTPLNDIRVNT
jgi:hypothetical protein